MKVTVQSEGSEGATIHIAKPSLRYLNEFLNLHCASDLVAWKLYPNVKEISESMAAYNVVRKYLWNRGFKPEDPNIRCICVGDGSTPRTAALFAVRTRWLCYSIDPKLRVHKAWNEIARLSIIRAPIESMNIIDYLPTILIAVHSHANLQAAVDICKPSAVVAIPCCVPQILEKKPDIQYEDYGVLSPKRTVMVWLP